MKFASVRASVVVAALLFGCGGSTPPAQDPPPPPLEDNGGGVEKASSADVQAGMDAIQGGDFAKAKQHLEKARAAQPDDPQAAYYLGVALENLSDAAGAQTAYQDALKLDPKLIEASVNLSAILLDAQKGSEALAVIEAALKHAPKDPRLLMNHALSLEAAGQIEKALDAYAAAVAATPDNIPLSVAYGQVLAGAGKKDEAVAQLRKSLALATELDVLSTLGDSLGKLGAFADCVAAFDKAIKKSEKPVFLVRRGVCRHELKDDAGAQADYEKSIQVDAKFAPGYFYLGQHLRALGKKKEALAALKKAVELGGDQGVGAAAKKAIDALEGKKK
ncbi:MAG TPA: tetratricopeptide repeat protein [Polyangiaceae bacterium]|nr:tetratricopeptide repeat protein [Polyangiaceae bacterium]HMR75780.1 tetratricopeptide repeat protein [Polyangiaceae bacterium]